jgi:predicted O-methyltransferase YrrM
MQQNGHDNCSLADPDNGGGLVIGSEIAAEKVAQAKANLRAASLGDYVDIRLGDATQTLANLDVAVDMVLMDGWKDHYLPLIKMLTPHLRPGAVVLSDNVTQFKKTLAPYLAYMSDPRNRFQSVTLPLASGFAYSVRI